jgi:hypothetical protein
VLAGGGVSAVADGRSKQVAQQTAAAEALATIEAMPVDIPPPTEVVVDRTEGALASVETPAP